MHFGPEWMRAKQHPTARVQHPPSPPPSSSYSALVSSMPPLLSEKRDEANPFSYSKEDMLGIYKDGPTKGTLGLEVERWEGVVREVANDPVGLREMGEAEKKLFSGSLNSELRRRQSVDYLSPLSTQSPSADRPRLNHSNSSTNSPLRERFGALRRRDSTDSPTHPLPRKHSLSSLQTPTTPSRDVGVPPPRTRVGMAPNFDGVLNSGDSRVARRRTSEASFRSAVVISREASGDWPNDARSNEIQEEKEDQDNLDNGIGKAFDGRPGEQSASPQSQLKAAVAHNQSSVQSEPQSAAVYTSYPSINAPECNKLDMPQMSSVPPQASQDLASVEWSYKDPTGQTQGPFRADLMQKWYDDGYFSPDLPMKRTHLDMHWTTVEELTRRASGGRIFLSHFLPAVPPGLRRRTDSPSQSYAASASTDHNLYAGLNQPSPIRTFRSSTLDSYIASGSNASDSPSSSFGAAKFSNGSPDPLAFGGGAGNSGYFTDPPVNGRISHRANIPDALLPLAARRAAYNEDPTLSLRSSAYSNVVPGRNENYAFDGAYNPGLYTPVIDSMTPSRNADPMSFNGYSQSTGLGPGLNYHNVRNGQDSAFHDNLLRSPSFNQLDYSTIDLSGQRLGLANEAISSHFEHCNALSGVAMDGAAISQSHFAHTSSTSYSPHVLGPSENALNPLDQHPITTIPSPSDPQLIDVISDQASQPLWQNIAEATAPRRQGLFDTPHPTTSINTTALPTSVSSQVSPWSNSHDASHQIAPLEETSWTFQGVVPDNWRESSDHDSLTHSNVEQHDQQQSKELQVSDVLTSDSSKGPPDQLNASPKFLTPVENSSVTVEVPVRPQQSRSKSIPQPDQQRGLTAAEDLDVHDKTDAPHQVQPQKAAWVKDEEPKKPMSISLREIQEAEAKKSEVRKAVERVSRVAPAISVDLKDEVQPYTASWGLPSSQAGARLTGITKEAPPISGPPVVVPSAPVWTSVVKVPPTKKSMKEIQEEEERRKKLNATKEKESAAAVAARKAHAEPMKQPSPATNQGNAWTTVGPNGKPTAVSAKPHPPTSSTTSPVTAHTPRVNGSSTARPSATVVPMKSASSAAPRIDDFPAAPSHEFLRWLTESLKGLNNTVNVEEILSMLLSFPMDPDPSTIELISDLIYTNSTTLDGRRFATEFVSKRKGDAASRAKNMTASGRASAKPVSIADVVKAAPKPAQSEWAFKVVNKKKKGGKS
ncbi:hypothetical protein AX17_000220 [Amanita inopinata Kibby_2008]|nr:hypothetical protein AX17_000220 [Amanita inopinata Kibby_2008]